jgi:hypothetical protein
MLSTASTYIYESGSAFIAAKENIDDTWPASLLYSGTRFLNFFPLSLFDSGSRAFLRLFLVGLLLVLFMAFPAARVLEKLLGENRRHACHRLVKKDHARLSHQRPT